MWRGTWHALTRFPAGPGGGDFIMVTSDATQRELEAHSADGLTPTLTNIVDFAADGIGGLEIADPTGLIAGL